MAATVSSVWAKPGSWALDSEEQEDELKREIDAKRAPEPASADFPSLAAAAASTKTKKKKPQTLSLAEFSSYGSGPSKQSQPQRLTPDELLLLPTGPRQRTAEEMDRTRLGGGFRSYGSDSANSRSRASERGGGYNVNSNRERDSSLSRADEADDWSKTKKNSVADAGFERREKVGFFNSQSSRADESDNWASNKSFAPSEGRRERRMGFDSFSSGGGGADSDNWLKKKEERDGFEGRRFDRSSSGFDRERRLGFESSGGSDLEHWGKKKEERENSGGSGGNGRLRLNLQPRTLPISNGQQSVVTDAKPKGANPFGEARPREEVLAEKGKDWKEIDEKLEAWKIKDDKGESVDGQGFRRAGFGVGRTESGDDRTVKSWRKEDSNDVPLPSAEKAENGVAGEA
ncbi:hypothetical protein Nepgr_025504 [Nepenthes gracilis]|uniref:Eukaryotic translation initiation factor 4B3-like n=1 Tax=Nepenthes gracilis TaxID=150966 RepID=A0AAD3T7X7_NEPGR|nr:hypothetical protein Nepgr_025504 [Nepenthes gracilis]